MPIARLTPPNLTFNITNSWYAAAPPPAPIVAPDAGDLVGTVGDFQIVRPPSRGGEYIIKRGKFWAKYMHVYDNKTLYLDGDRNKRVMNIPPSVHQAIINWFDVNHNSL